MKRFKRGPDLFMLALATPPVAFFAIALIVTVAAPYPQALWASYLLIGLGFLYLVGCAIGGAAWCLWRGIRRLLARRHNRHERRERRINRHAMSSMALANDNTVILARFEDELSDLTQFYVFKEDLR